MSKALFDVGKLSFAIVVATPLVARGMGAWLVALVGTVLVLSLFVLATRLLKEIR